MLRRIGLLAVVLAVLLSIAACGEQFKTQGEAYAHAEALIKAQCPQLLDPNRLTDSPPIMNVNQDSDGTWWINIHRDNVRYPDKFWIKDDGSLAYNPILGVC